MRAYASRTGTARNLDALRAAGWGLLVSATGVHRDEGFDDIILDNGAWSAFNSSLPWSGARFLDLLEVFGCKARLIVAPDIVAGGSASLDLSVSWLPSLAAYPGISLIPVQDGMTPSVVRPLLGETVGIFVGGTTAWKWASLRKDWGPLAAEVGCWLHVGRAGSGRMIERCALAGADSFDTSEPSRYRCKLAGLDNARRQLPLAAPGWSP